MTEGSAESRGRRRRVALFGGSFDPPHRGHVAIARAAADGFALDEVLFTPTARQPLKPGGGSASYADRLGMVSLLSELDARFRVSELDAPRSDGQPNYTVDTLEGLGELFPGAEIFAIAGADSFLQMPQWYRWRRLLELADWIVVSRPGFATEQIARMSLSDGERSRVHLIENVQERVSATEVRERLRRGESCRGEVPGAVLGYVRDHGLYARG